MQPRSVHHRPVIVYGNCQHDANLCARQPVNFAHHESIGDALGKSGQTIGKHRLKLAFFNMAQRALMVPFGGRVSGVPMPVPFVVALEK